jgi:N-acetylmuramoyl-L-alanine amidase
MKKRIFLKLRNCRVEEVLNISFFFGLAVIVTIFSAGGVFGKSNVEKEKKIVVIDPGHGGTDIGAKGQDGTVEKTIALTIARMVLVELESRYRVILTRADDLEVDPADRTARANTEKANLFISIHTGASFLHEASGVEVFVFETPTGQMPVQEEKKIKTWDRVQITHKKESREFAEALLNSIAMIGTGVRLHGAPLVVLEGADMPAVLLEIGQLTNPLDEKKLRETAELTVIAKAIAAAVSEFLK